MREWDGERRENNIGIGRGGIEGLLLQDILKHVEGTFYYRDM